MGKEYAPLPSLQGNAKAMNKKWALFWCKLHHSISFGGIEKKQTNQYLKSLYLHEIIFPNRNPKSFGIFHCKKI